MKIRYSPTVIWPKVPIHPYVKTGSDGSVIITAVNNTAVLILENHRRSFTVKFIAKCTNLKGDEEFSEITQQHSVRTTLEFCQHPIHLALQAAKNSKYTFTALVLLPIFY